MPGANLARQYGDAVWAQVALVSKRWPPWRRGFCRHAEPLHGRLRRVDRHPFHCRYQPELMPSACAALMAMQPIVLVLRCVGVVRETTIGSITSTT